MMRVRPARFSLAAAVVLAAVVLAACSGPIVKHRAVAKAPPITASPVTTQAAHVTTTTAPALTGAAVHAATDPDRLAAEMTDVEIRLHGPRTSFAGLALQALRQQLAYERLAAHPDWLSVVLARVPARWRATVEANSQAAIDLSALSTPLTPGELKGWKITPPAPAATLLGYYHEAQAITGVPWDVLAAIHLVETKMSRLRVPSSAGAQGPMQFLPATWASYGQGDINSDSNAILAAARYLRAMGAPGDLAGAIYHYNPSQRYVQAVLAYAAQITTDPSAFLTYYYWQVVIVVNGNEVVLPDGYPSVPAIAAG